MLTSLAITLGQRFLSYQSFSEALEDWCIAENFTVRKGKKESDITTVYCAVNKCPFCVGATLGGEDGVAVYVLRSEQHEDVPCAHAWSLLMAESNIAPRDWMPYNLTLEAYRKAYTQHMPPVDISNLYPEEDREHPCRAPNSKRKKAWKATDGDKSAWRKGPRRQQKCGNCEQVGHN